MGLGKGVLVAKAAGLTDCQLQIELGLGFNLECLLASFRRRADLNSIPECILILDGENGSKFQNTTLKYK